MEKSPERHRGYYARRGAGQCGFTLVELMVVVAVIGILATIAYPNYQRYVQRSNRSAAIAFMLEVASAQERYRLDARTYAPDLATLGSAVPAEVSPRYTVTLGGVTATTFTVTAAPIGSQASDGCGTLTLNESGTKTASGGSVADCWQR